MLSSPGFTPARDDAAQSATQQALAHLLENFTREVRLPDLAARLGMSPWAFSRFFKKNTGNSFTDYLTALRIGFACKLLAESDLPVTDVCFEAGYTNVSNFNRIFRQRRGMTPTAYRGLARQRMGCRAHPVASGADDLLRPHEGTDPSAAMQHA